MVWRGGGRRYFTRKAAERAVAKQIINKRCECDRGDYHTPAYTCSLHRDPLRYERMIRLLLVMFVRRT